MTGADPGTQHPTTSQDVTVGHAPDTGNAALDAEQTRSDADQTASDSDQTASDSDQTLSERDDADAARDQRVSDLARDSALDQRAGPIHATEVQGYEAARLAREASRMSRLATHVERSRNVTARAASAALREESAAARHATARHSDIRARAIDRSIGDSDAPLAKKLEQVRARAAADRARAAVDRARAAQDRADAARELARLEAELHRAHLDDLTGALRREPGWLALTLEIDRARRGDGRFVLAFIDIDGLKPINDRKGHAAGDQVLQAVVRTIRTNVRSFDPIVRYGGDEFVCGIGGADLADVERRFEAIGQAIHDDVGVRISLGLAALAPGETLDDLTDRADAALLKSRSRHRGAAGPSPARTDPPGR